MALAETPNASHKSSSAACAYNTRVNRRTFLGDAGAAALAGAAACTSNLFSAPAERIPIIDSHIHLFDVSRPQGVPWPRKGSPIYRSSLPDGYRKLAEPHGIVGAIAIECSPWPADNEWVLDVARDAPVIVGTIGNLEPSAADFGNQLERLHKNPLFRGIRYGNLWGRDLGNEVSKPTFIAGLKLLADADLALDTANPTPALMRAAVRVTDQVPSLRIVLDHLPELKLPDEPEARKACDADLRSLAARPNVFAKISGIVRRVDGRVPLDVNFYRDRLDHIWEIFGPDRLLYGSDWPNSAQWASYPEIFGLARDFISSKDPASVEKIYWKNSLQAYRWKRR
jgi:predicted TIM-barrel fold metal-dependent hydrolase